MNCCAIVIPCYLIFVDLLSQHFIKILIPLYGKFFLLKLLLFQCFHVSWLRKKSYHISPKKAKCICKNKAIYFRWKKLFREIKTVSWIPQKKWPFFMSEYKLFEFIWIIAHNSQRITLLNVSMIKGYKC